MRKLLLVHALLLPMIASAGIVQTAENSSSQVTMSRDTGGVASCGLRIASFIQPGKDIRWYDFSLSVYRQNLAGLLKAGSYIVDVATFNKTGKLPDPRTVVRTPAPRGFWVADFTNKPPAELRGLMASPDKGFVIGHGDFPRIAELIFQIAAGEQTQFSVQYSPKGVDDVVNFEAPLSETDFKTLKNCMAGLQEGIASDLEKYNSAGKQ